jgi:hypothetical protein
VIRVLLNSDPVDGGVVTPEVNPAVEVKPTPKAEAKPAPKPVVKVSPDEFVKMTREVEALRAQNAELSTLAEKVRSEERAKYEADIAKSETALKSLEALKGQYQSEFEKTKAEKERVESEWKSKYESDLSAKDAALAEREREILTDKKSALVNSLMAGREIAGSTPEEKAARKEQLETLLSLRVDVKRDDEGKVVAKDAKTGKFLSEVSATLLDAPEYGHFFAASTKGGSGAADKGQARDATPNPSDDDLKGLTAGERIILANRAKAPAAKSSWPTGGLSAFRN